MNRMLIAGIGLLLTGLPMEMAEARKPSSEMREMSTDRPDKTESPYTLDAGHYVVEMSLFEYSYDKEDGEKTNEWNFAPMNLKVGLTDNTDLQLVLEPHIIQKVKSGTGIERSKGFGSPQTRLKINLWGNDGGPTAAAVMPFIKWPIETDFSNDALEGGLIVPIAFALPWGWGMGYMTEIDVNQNAGDDDYHAEFINSITFGHNIIGNLDGYVEFFSSVSAENKVPWVGTVDLGLTYGLTPDIQLDAGVNLGVTRGAEDINPFCGLSMRY